MSTNNMISFKRAQKEIENYLDLCSYDKSRINNNAIKGFIEMCNSDYDEWIKEMLDSYFNDNNQKFVGGNFFFEK